MEVLLGYRSTPILPAVNDLSARVFDAPLACQVLVVSPRSSDFDEVFPPQVLAELGMIRLADLPISAIGDAAKKAVEIFDRSGAAGAKARHEYALANYMLVYMHWDNADMHARNFRLFPVDRVRDQPRGHDRPTLIDERLCLSRTHLDDGAELNHAETPAQASG